MRCLDSFDRLIPTFSCRVQPHSMHSSECPGGQVCNGPQRNCFKTHKVGAPLSWCGADAEDAASGCHQACPEGTDDECPDGMTCWATSGQCTMLDSYLEVIEERKKFLWCGSSYRHLVENCAEPCPSGSDDECGVDDDGNEMTCWDMSEEEMYCNTTGVGIVEPTDPDMLWCGNSWNNVLEECPKKCPSGSDEECGFFGVCYDLTGNDLICKTEGFGVKKKGDPNKRFCGDSYMQMMEFCPKRCPMGNEVGLPDSDIPCMFRLLTSFPSPSVSWGLGLLRGVSMRDGRTVCAWLRETRHEFNVLRSHLFRSCLVRHALSRRERR